jgi:hypothetical protein
VTGREKIEAAFTPAGAPEFAVVLCYEGIYTRDHFGTVTDCPWWWAQSPVLEQQLEWHRQAYARTGMDWFHLGNSYSSEERCRLRMEERRDGVYLVDTAGGTTRNVEEPRIAGWHTGASMESIHPDRLADTTAELDALVPVYADDDPMAVLAGGRGELAAAMIREFGRMYPIRHITSPLWGAYQVWGFEGLMYMVAARPDLVEYVCRRGLRNQLLHIRQAAALGARGIWIEECFTDMVGPAAFARLNVPFVRALVDEIRAHGMQSIYYFCGNPHGKWEMLLEPKADALSLEESKKGWEIDIDDVVRRVDGRCVVFGNLDAIDLLENGSDTALRAEVKRQVEAGRRNGSRFVMSIGSPVTPGTTVARVRRFCDLVHEIG